MKRNLLFISACFFGLITLNTQAQSYVSAAKELPQLNGMMGAKVIHTDKGWGLARANGSVYIFAADKKHQLQKMLRPGHTKIEPAELTQLSLTSTDNIPDEFYAVPYGKLSMTRLYHCVYSDMNNRIFCRNVPLTARPVMPTAGPTRITY